MVVDLVLKGGTIYTSQGSVRAGIACDEGKIVMIGKEEHLPPGNTILDVNNKIIIPGFIDSHVHFRDPGFTYKEDFSTGSMAAAVGGITMVVDMPNTKPPANSLERVREHVKNAEIKSFVDFNTWALPTIREEVPEIAKFGVVGFKFFMKVWHYPYGTETAISSPSEILETFRLISKFGLPCLVHPHDNILWEHNVKRWKDKGKNDFQAYREAQWADSDIIKTTAAANLVLLANAVKAKLRLLHVNERPYIHLARTLKQGGYNFITEMNPWGLFIPSNWPQREDMGLASEVQWKALNDGTIDLIASDHAPHTKEEFEKTQTNAFESVGGVLPYVENYLSFFLTEVNRGKIGLERLITLCSENVAKHLGVYPRKGTIQIGSDADLVVVDMKKEDTIKTETVISKCGWTPYDGVKVKGVPIYTILRGAIVAENRRILVKQGYGKFIPPIITQNS